MTATAANHQNKDGGERIRINKKRPWGAVPEALVVDVRLGTTARLVGVWLCIRPPGWIVRREHLLSVLGIGLDAWWRARKQLLQLGYLVEHKAREGGRFTSANLEFFPEPVPAATTQGFTEHGQSEPGSAKLGEPEPLPTTVLTPVLTPPPQRAADKVVVVDEVEIEWPAGLSAEQIRACGEALVNAKPERRQALADELTGAMACRPIANPPGWLRGLARRELAGGVLLELAPAIARARAAKAAAAARTAAAMIAPAPPSRAGAMPVPVRTPRQVAGRQAALAQLAAIRSDGAASAPAP
jgi:hypothetical protein